MMFEFKFEKNLDNLKIYLLKDIRVNEQLIPKNTLLGQTNRPKLTWDYERIESDNKIFKELIRDFFGPSYTKITYDQLEIDWISKGLFPPSIDSMFFMKNLRKHYSNKDYKKIIDVGTGTGVLGLYLLKKNPHIKKAILTDYQPQAAIDVSINSKINGLEQKIEFIESNGLNISIPKVNLIISNPPYIPETPEMKENRGKKVNPYQGTDLIKDLIKNYSNFSDELLLEVSSVCKEEVKAFNKAYNKKPEVISTMDVPARFSFLESEHREYLLDSKKIIVKDQEEFIEKSTDNGLWPNHELVILKYNC